MSKKFEDDKANMTDNLPNVYSIYNRKLQLTEEEFINDCNQSMDSLLVFAGLFSAVVIQLIATTTQDLKNVGSDSQGQGQGTGPSSLNFETLTVVVNALFLFSLITSLFAAVMAILVKQWARRSTSGFRNISSARRKARARHEKYEGRANWHLEDVVSFVPMMLHFALLLFFIGLVIWIKTLNQILFYIMTSTVILITVIYLATSVLPLKWPDAPYEWQVTTAFRWIRDGLYKLTGFLGAPFRLCQSARQSNTPLLGEGESLLRLKDPAPRGRPFITTPEPQPLTVPFNLGERPLDEVDVELMMETLQRADTDQEVKIAFSQLRTGFRRVDIPSQALNRGHMELALIRLRELSALCWHFADDDQTQFILRRGYLSRAKDAARFLEWLLQLDTTYLSLINADDIVLGFASWKFGSMNLDLESVVLGASVTYRGEHLIGARGPGYSCTHPRSGRELLGRLCSWGPFAGQTDETDTKVPDTEWNEENKTHHRNMVEVALAALTDCIAFHYHPEHGANDVVLGELVSLSKVLLIGTKDLGVHRLRRYVQFIRRSLPDDHWAKAWFNSFET